MDASSLNYQLYSTLASDGVALEEGTSPVGLRKAVKNAREIAGMREAHLQDGVAMERYLYWLEKSVAAGREITEWDAAVKLGQLRGDRKDYLGDSFETISAYGPGAALPHYITPHNYAPVIRDEGLYLCDSGGQYTCGTTDITRTVPMGRLSALEREDYTLVLKGHIALAMAVFPEGTPGCRLDALARAPLWRSKRNFGHGTGHGVGWFLGVHAAPLRGGRRLGIRALARVRAAHALPFRHRRARPVAAGPRRDRLAQRLPRARPGGALSAPPRRDRRLAAGQDPPRVRIFQRF